MQARELFEAGNLVAAIECLNHDVRAHPTDMQRRTFLFELLCFAGDYQRAARQLEAIGHQSSSADIGVQIYRNILTAEEARQRFFSHGLRPQFLFPPPAYTHFHLEALNRLRENRPAEARALLEQSEQSRPRLAGHLDGQAFADFRDADDLLAPFLEVIMHDDYVWLPFEQLKQMTIPAPQKLRDLLWLPATIEAHQGPVGGVFLPVLYAGSGTHDDDRVKLGRMTDWTSTDGGPVRGFGQRLFITDTDDRAMLEVRQVDFLPHPVSA